MFGAILKATNSYFQKGMIFCRSIYVKKVMKLLAFIFEQPSYILLCFICKMRFTVYTAETKIKDTFLLTYYCAVRNSVDIVFLFLNVFNDIIRTECCACI